MRYPLFDGDIKLDNNTTAGDDDDDDGGNDDDNLPIDTYGR
jgi:hypothetical protein